MSEKGIQDGVQVNAINPGPVRTARFAKRLESTTEEAFLREEKIARIGEPADIAALVSFILSPARQTTAGLSDRLRRRPTKTI